MKTYTRFLLILVIIALTFAFGASAQARSPNADAYDSQLPIDWFDLHLDLARNTPGFTPPVVSRALAYTGVALYEAVVPGMPGYQSLAGHLSGLQPLPQPVADHEYDWRIVANSTPLRNDTLPLLQRNC